MTDAGAFLQEAIRLAYDNVAQGGRPFGAVVVKDGAVIAAGVNEILSTNDPTAHAELTALRKASAALGTPDLSGCTVYASGQPCPMCMAAMRMAGVSAVAYAYSNEDGAPHGLSTAAVAAELARPPSRRCKPPMCGPAHRGGRTSMPCGTSGRPSFAPCAAPPFCCSWSSSRSA